MERHYSRSRTGMTRGFDDMNNGEIGIAVLDWVNKIKSGKIRETKENLDRFEQLLRIAAERLKSMEHARTAGKTGADSGTGFQPPMQASFGRKFSKRHMRGQRHARPSSVPIAEEQQREIPSESPGDVKKDEVSAETKA